MQIILLNLYNGKHTVFAYRNITVVLTQLIHFDMKISSQIYITSGLTTNCLRCVGVTVYDEQGCGQHKVKLQGSC